MDNLYRRGRHATALLKTITTTKIKTCISYNNAYNKILFPRKFFRKFDTVLSSIDTSPINTDQSLNSLWEGYTACIADARADGCLREGRAMWTSALNVLALVFETAAEDMITYFTEVNGEFRVFTNSIQDYVTLVFLSLKDTK